MKILMAVRLYSGFRDSLSSGVWAPGGSPAISKLIERFSIAGDEIDVVLLTGDDTHSGDANGGRIKSRTMEGLSIPLTVMSYRLTGELTFFGRLRPYAEEVIKFLWLWRRVRATEPDVIYMDRGNVINASLLARFQSVPVVLRMLGVPPETKREIRGTSPFEKIVRWAYKAPFALVVCSQDGSGGEKWLDEMTTSDVPLHVLLNGVDTLTATGPLPSRLASISRPGTKVLFLGRFDTGKQSLLFVESMIIAASRVEDLHTIIVGYGPEKEDMERLIDEAGCQSRFTFVGSLPHEDVGHAFAISDIYVSLNLSGNMSNANLEALKSGICVVVPQSDPVSGVDETLDDLFPPQSIRRLPPDYDAQAVSSVIEELCQDHEQREKRAREIAQISAVVLSPWSERIDREYELLASAARGEKL